MSEIQDLEKQIFELKQKLRSLRKKAEPQRISDYPLQDQNGETSLLKLFGDKDILFAIHNMGPGCRYCTLWADGLNGFLPHLEDRFSVVLLSKDSPEAQRRMANDRGWRFRLASHAGGDYIKQQSVLEGQENYPGLVCYRRDGERIFRMNAVSFGPGDDFCSIWGVLSLAGFSEDDWTPQFHYWKRPGEMEDGGANLIE